MTFADKPWRPADHPRPGPSWRAEPSLVEVLEGNDRAEISHQGSGASSFAPRLGLSTAEQAVHSAGNNPRGDGVKVEIRATAEEVTLVVNVRHGFYAELRALARAQGTEPAQLVANAIGQLVPRTAAIEAGSGVRR